MAKLLKSYWNEEWVQFGLEFETKTKDYFVSNYGRLKSVDKLSGDERLLKAATLKQQGYKVTNVSYVGNFRKTYYVQQLVAEAFCEGKKEGVKNYIIHLDKNTANNHFLNLKYVDREGLNEHFEELGVWDPQKKKRNPAYKMNPRRVKLLKERLKDGKTKKSILAKTFNITLEQLRKIEKGIDWAWVTIEEKTEEKTEEKAEEKIEELNVNWAWIENKKR